MFKLKVIPNLVKTSYINNTYRERKRIPCIGVKTCRAEYDFEN